MRTIYKYPFPSGTSEQSFVMSAAGIPRFVGMQYQQVCIWVEIDTLHKSKRRTFKIFGTGHEFNENAHYIGTCVDGPFIWHVCELI